MEQTEPIKLHGTLSGIRFNQSDDGAGTIIIKVGKIDTGSVAALAMFLPCNIEADVWVKETL